MQWFRSYHGAPTDNKLGLIAQKKGVARPVVIAVWWYVLDFGSQNTPRGTITGFEVEEAAFALGADEADVEACLAGFRERGMLDGDHIAAWDSRQPKRDDDSSERVKRFRDKQKAEQAEPVTQRNAPVTQRNAPDTDTDIEKKDTPLNPPKGGKARGTKLPENFPDLHARHLAEAYWFKHQREDIDFAEQASKFRAHHTAKGTASKSWPASWQTWYMNALQYAKPPPLQKSAGRSELMNEILRRASEPTH